jgi:hypothetical protein
MNHGDTEGTEKLSQWIIAVFEKNALSISCAHFRKFFGAEMKERETGVSFEE